MRPLFTLIAHKVFNRYKDYGLSGLENRARSPYRHPNKLPFQTETAILRIKRKHPSHGKGDAPIFCSARPEK